ncbi:MAG: hypothetical protein M0040_03105 [Actinomycetota bacterium]|nr:hypothetical protein [Actinomycetota bacterium]
MEQHVPWSSADRVGHRSGRTGTVAVAVAVTAIALRFAGVLLGAFTIGPFLVQPAVHMDWSAPASR